MKSAVLLLGVVLIVAVPSIGTADEVNHVIAAAIEEGAQIDKNCLKQDKIKDIGVCRTAATGIGRTPAVSLGLFFHMWFSDAALSRLYRDKNAELSALFERLADAEFPAAAAYEQEVGVRFEDVCRIAEVNCTSARQFDAEWRQRVPQGRGPQ